MGLPLFYIDGSVTPQVGDILALSGAEGRHAVTVARIRPGERILLGDGSGLLTRCSVVGVRGKDALDARVEHVARLPEPTPTVTVVQAIPKSERSELAVDLATEAGADRIVAWQSARCVSRWIGPKAEKHVNKWRSAALAAAKQSRRPWIPDVRGPIATNDLLAAVSAVAADGVVAILHEEATEPFAQLPLSASAQVMLIVGPEGGLDDAEMLALTAAGGIPVSLGPQVLRTSTAAAIALGAVGVLTTRWETDDSMGN